MEKRMERLLECYPELAVCRAEIEQAADRMTDCYRQGGKILVCGNGGSCADSDHIVGELMKGFLLRRPMREAQSREFRRALGDGADRFAERLQCGIPAISLPSQAAVLSAFANDVDPELVYAQLVFGYARREDLLICLSTSGNSRNVAAAAEVARAMGVGAIALTGERESRLSELCGLCIRVPQTETYRVQELHLPVYHYLCAEVEARVFG